MNRRLRPLPEGRPRKKDENRWLSLVSDSRTDVILHYNGASWSPAGLTGIPQELRGVWGSSSSDVFVVGEGGTIVHYAPK
jgi:hypothetical protein